MAHIRKAMTVQKHRSFLISQIRKQQKWIEGCEANGKSYTGENGVAIRQADNNHLRELEIELNECN